MRWILPLVVLVGGFVLWRNVGALHWRDLAPGLEFATLRGEPYCRSGSTAIAVLRMDPERVRLRVHHFSQAGGRPLDVVEWQRFTGALAVFNAGQFYPDWRYMGLLASGGKWLSRRPHPGYHAVLVADRQGPGLGARVLDLSDDTKDPDSLGWNEVAQSFMLFDTTGALRVRKSEKIAKRTIVGEDRRHRLLVMVTEGAYSLSDIAWVLQHSRLQLRQAMSMDGGRESEMVIVRGAFRYASFGAWTGEEEHPTTPESRAPLPCVIGIELP
ncbi:MAG TPA: phosphodiester glycosidase family protein [Verrucomicrobiae bacterium]|nr:phosphodiester glycosidase family protein [Verrucomicrobiae bacterium]